MIPLPPLPPAPARGDPCHSVDAAILLLQLQPTQNAPSPREPLLHGAEHSGKGISGSSPEGSTVRGGRNQIRESRCPRSKRLASPHSCACALQRLPSAQAWRGLSSPPLRALLHFLSSTVLLLPVSHLGAAGRLLGCRALGLESKSGRGHLHFFVAEGSLRPPWKLGIDSCSLF